MEGDSGMTGRIFAPLALFDDALPLLDLPLRAFNHLAALDFCLGSPTGVAGVLVLPASIGSGLPIPSIRSALALDEPVSA